MVNAKIKFSAYRLHDSRNLFPLREQLFHEFDKNGRRDEDQQFRLGIGILCAFEQVDNVGNVTQQRCIRYGNSHFLAGHPTKHDGVAVIDQHTGINLADGYRRYRGSTGHHVILVDGKGGKLEHFLSDGIKISDVFFDYGFFRQWSAGIVFKLLLDARFTQSQNLDRTGTEVDPKQDINLF
jgi:hypothetical protein